MYLRNISAKTTGLDDLLLNAGSAVWVNAGTTDATKSTAFSYNTTGDAVAMIEAERALAHPVRCQKIN